MSKSSEQLRHQAIDKPRVHWQWLCSHIMVKVYSLMKYIYIQVRDQLVLNLFCGNQMHTSDSIWSWPWQSHATYGQNLSSYQASKRKVNVSASYQLRKQTDRQTLTDSRL